MTELTSLSNDELLASWKEAGDAIRKAELEQFAIHQEIATRMNTERAELWTSDGVEAVFKPANDWDQGRLAALAEFIGDGANQITPFDFEGLLAPVKPVDRKFLIPQIVKLAKRGEPFRSIIESSKRQTPPALKIRRTE